MALTKIKTGGIADNAITDAKVADNITAGTAATLATARNINGVSFNLSSAITGTAAAGTLTGATLASGVTASSLTSVGTLTALTTGAITQNAGTFTIKNASSDSNGLKIYQDSGDASKIYNHYNGKLQLGVGSTTALTIDSSENSTFAGTVILGDLDIIPTSSNVSVIKHDSGSGSLTLQGDQVNIKNRAADETGLSYNDGGGVTFPNNVIIGGENATPEVELFYNHSNGSDYKAYLQLAGNDLEVRSSSGTMEFYTGAVDGTSSTERMRITAGGYVGIQTVDNSGDYTAQTISAPLHVLQKTASQTYGLVVQGNSNANGGRIGIGEADSNFTTRANVIDIGFDSSTDFIWSRTGKEMLIGVDNSEKVRIKTSATIFSGDNLVGIGQGTPTSSPLEVNLTQTNATVGSSGFAHFGSSGTTDGYIQGISLGFRESNANYRKVAIAARGKGDGAARSDLVFLVDTANDAASASLGDAKITIDGVSGNTSIHNDLLTSRRISHHGLNVYVKDTDVASSSGSTFTILRSWHDTANWGQSMYLVEIFQYYYSADTHNYAAYNCAYGYASSTTVVEEVANTGSINAPAWTGETTISGNLKHRNLELSVGAYQYVKIRVTTPDTYTDDPDNNNNNTVHIYP